MKITELDDDRSVYKVHRSQVVHLDDDCPRLHSKRPMERTAGKLFGDLTVCQSCTGMRMTGVDSGNNGIIEMLEAADPDDV